MENFLLAILQSLWPNFGTILFATVLMLSFIFRSKFYLMKVFSIQKTRAIKCCALTNSWKEVLYIKLTDDMMSVYCLSYHFRTRRAANDDSFIRNSWWLSQLSLESQWPRYSSSFFPLNLYLFAFPSLWKSKENSWQLSEWLNSKNWLNSWQN